MRVRAMLGVLLLAWPLTPLAQAPALKIVVVEGEDAVNIVQQRTAVAPVVEVRDRNDLPIAGIPVTFSVGSGAATFGGGQTLTVVTNAAGRAVAAGLTPTANGAIQISASAAFQGQAAVATITQTNVLTAAQAAAAAGSGGAGSAGAAGTGAGSAGGGGLSAGGVAGIAGGVAAAAVGTVLATRDDAGASPVSLTVLPAGAGIREVTEFRFYVAGGDAAGGFTWNFGDGTTAQGASVTHTFQSEGVFTVGVRSTAGGSGQDLASATVPVGSVTGSWRREAVGGVINRLVAVQQGNSITGQWIVEYEVGSPFGSPANNTSVPLRGTVTSPLNVTLEQMGDCQRTITNGQISADLKTMGGSGFYGNFTCGGGDGSGPVQGGWFFTRQ